MGRRYVHLAVDIATAKQMGKRKTSEPVILSVRARDAYQAGVRFYLGNDQIWLSDPIDPQFIDQQKI